VTETRAPGRPRSPEADAAIVRATLELLSEDGYRALSAERVARRAGVGKATVYRRYRGRDDLVTAAIQAIHSDLRIPDDTGSLIGDYGAITAQAAADGAQTGMLTFMPRLLAEAANDPAMHALFTEHLVEPRRAVVRAVLERAVARGEIRDDVDLDVAVDLIAGPMVYRLMLGGMDLPRLREHAGAVLDAALAGLTPRPRGRRPR
jgi:AcrR family transcriptional regulator